jgi:restriction system protein
MLLAIISPQARQLIYAVGFIGFCVFGMVVVGLIGFAVYRWRTRSKRAVATDAFVLSSITHLHAPPVNIPRIEVLAQPKSTAPQTTVELLEQLRSIDWFQFEQLVALVYRKQGYVVSRRGGANPDGGIDLVIEKDGTRTAIQCKHWKTWNVGVKTVREFLGALTDAGIQRGLFITLGGYTGDAKRLADKHGIEVVNEVGLARMLEATDAKFDPAALEILWDTQKLCPKCERQMVLRTASKGPGAGEQFWGCSGYPKCRFTMPLSKDRPRAELAAVR